MSWSSCSIVRAAVAVGLRDNNRMVTATLSFMLLLPGVSLKDFTKFVQQRVAVEDPRTRVRFAFHALDEKDAGV